MINTDSYYSNPLNNKIIVRGEKTNSVAGPNIADKPAMREPDPLSNS